MTKKHARLYQLLVARVGLPGENLSKISRESGVFYNTLYLFYTKHRPLDFDSFDRLHKHLTGEELKTALPK